MSTWRPPGTFEKKFFWFAADVRFDGISQEIAEEQGVVLEQVLSEFLRDVHDVCQRGGCLVRLKRSFLVCSRRALR